MDMGFLRVVWKIIRWLGNLILRLVPSGNKWQEIHASSAMRPEQTLKRYQYLRNKGVRCKLHNLSSPFSRMSIVGMISLRVYCEDAGKAFALLRDIKD
jgi:hypothetical protein